jgi:hypothetical protein
MHPLTPYPVLVFVDGPAVTDTPSLVAWLATHDGGTRQLALPVSIGVASFEVGGIPIHVSDSALGVSLADHVRTKCKGQARCRLWLEGYWSANTLHLRRVGELVDDDEVAWVAVEAEHREGPT